MSTHLANANREALTRAIEARVKELRITYREVAETAGYSPSWIRYVRTDFTRQITPEFAAQLDKALQWAEGSTMAILDGGKPTPIAAPPVTALHAGNSAGAAPRTGTTAPQWAASDSLGPELPGSILEMLERWQPILTPRQYAQLTVDLVRVRENAYMAGWMAGQGQGHDQQQASSPPPDGGDQG